jgi:hypothetical protein
MATGTALVDEILQGHDKAQKKMDEARKELSELKKGARAVSKLPFIAQADRERLNKAFPTRPRKEKGATKPAAASRNK